MPLLPDGPRAGAGAEPVQVGKTLEPGGPAVEVPVFPQVLQTCRLSRRVIQRIVDVEFHPPELVEYQGGAAVQDDPRVLRHPLRDLDPDRLSLRALDLDPSQFAGLQFHALNVFGNGLPQEEPVRSDPQTGAHGQDARVSPFKQLQVLAVLPDEPERLFWVSAQAFEVSTGVGELADR